MRLFRLLTIIAGLCVSAPLPPLYAQARTVPAITFAGAPAYSQSELLAFTGLRPGSSITQQQMDEAAQRLNDIGLFDEVSFAGNDKGIVYTLKPVAASAMLPVRFGNFVWWQDEEIDGILQKRVPLYHSTAVPAAGKMRETIAAVLSAMLVEKGVSGAFVSSVLSSSHIGGPIERVAFKIDSPPVVIHSLVLADASPAMQAKLARVVKDMVGQPWDEATTYPNIASRVGDVYRNEGYLDIAVPKQDRSAPVVGAGSIDLDLTAKLSEGAQYHVAQLMWPGSELLSTVDFNKQATLKPGDPDSPVALRESLRSLSAAYGAKGYVAAKIEAPPTIDRAAHQVAYTISVVPGSQYRLKSVEFPRVPDAQAAELAAAWRIKPGDIYDSTYFIQFLRQNAAAALLKQGYKVNETVKLDSNALTAEVAVIFTKPGTPQ